MGGGSNTPMPATHRGRRAVGAQSFIRGTLKSHPGCADDDGEEGGMQTLFGSLFGLFGTAQLHTVLLLGMLAVVIFRPERVELGSIPTRHDALCRRRRAAG